jgi:hypothetical protein
LARLLAQGSNLKDVSAHRNFKDDGRPGTFENGSESQKIDYILPSPELFNSVENAEVFRKGDCGKNGDLFQRLSLEMTKPIHAASDHAALVVDLDL